MTEHPAPREDRIVFPTAWASRLLPRRGTRPGRPMVLDPEAPARLRKELESHRSFLDEILLMRKNRKHASVVRAHLDGRPDPRGAAAVSTFLRNAGPHEADWWGRLELHAWVQEHGLAWTVRACIERCAVQLRGYPRPGNRRGPLGDYVLVPLYMYDAPTLNAELDSGAVAELRGLLAAASDEEYAEAVAAAAGHRDTVAKRLAATLFLPGQADWAFATCTEYRTERRSAATDRIIAHSVSGGAHLEAAGITGLDEYHVDIESTAALVDSAGAASLPILTATLDEPRHMSADTKRLLLKAVAMIPSDEAAAYLANRLDRPHVFDCAVDAAARYPSRMARALTAADATDAAKRARLAAVAAVIDQSGRLDAAERAALDALTAAARPVPEADPADLPPLLTAPPWVRKRAKAKGPVIEGLEPIGEPRLVWAEGEREAWSEEFAREYERDADAVRWKRQLLRRPTGSRRWLDTLIAFGPKDIAATALEEWNASDWDPMGYIVRSALTRFGAAVIDKAVDAAAADGSDWTVLGPVLSASAARLAADRLARLKSVRAAAVAWFDRHGLDAAVLLVPDALGKDRKARTSAEAALGHLTLNHGAEAVAAGAEPYGPEAVQALTDLLAGDPLEPRGVKVPKPGSWASPPMFPQLLLKGRERALPAESVRHLLTVLALATPDHRYAGLEVVAETCDRASLARFSRAVFEQWLTVGAPPKDGWALTQLAHFAEDETVWALTPHLRAWPGEGQHKRAVTGLGVLGAIGTEEALRAIQGIADKVRFEALKHEATRQIDAVAAGLGLDRDQLADRLVPEFGLGDERALVLDYGPRRFTVAFDEHLKPYAIDASGKPRKTLPRPAAKDDPVLAEESYKRFGALRKELRNVAAEQIARLEVAMVRGRTWRPEEFRRFFVDHALTGHLARRLVWLAETGGTRTGFRIAEDGTYSDIEDETRALPSDAVIRVAHPALLGAEVGAWAEVLADYEILQPFDQLSRPVFAFTAEELATGRLTRFEGPTVDVGRLIGMTRGGWRRAAPEDGGMSPGIAYPLPGGGYLTVAVEPGIYAGYASEFPDQTVRGVLLDHTETYDVAGADPERERPERIDPVTASEALAALARLTGAS
ncbi:DUF4132 domain-containing protein [Glycomyces sp. NRRL B-16210]|uniref:DUF4132 domain-containing protein n=1 Tax=Glycomyces sp. NRRL B-16210 TaxID=1463821 RepID=UPI00105BDDF7|nr:DUF4132 domain-containing protein [Glycomyces sp. NRRL B-16210]